MFRSILCVSVLFVILFSCQQKTDVASDIEAIKAVNQKQIDAQETYSYEGESTVWLHAPYVLHMTADWGHKKIGWDALSDYYKNRFEKLKNDSITEYKFKVENFDVQIDGNFACATYDESFIGTVMGTPYDQTVKVHKYFIKHEGEWKILAIF